MVNKTQSATTDEQARMDQLEAEVLARCDALGLCSDMPDCLSRLFCSPAMQRAHDLMRGWLQEAGLEWRLDAAGNLVGRWEPEGCDVSRRLVIGSHLDTVIDAGKYDGILGVLLGVTVAAELKRRGVALPWAIEAVGYSDEEGVRYKTPFLGSRAWAGTFDDSLLRLVDAGGVPLVEALRKFGVDPLQIHSCAATPGEIVAYLEAHIEQGPQLELAGAPLAVVSAIAGQTRLTVQWTGPGGHAGTVPMAGRRDPFTAACRWALAVEQCGLQTPGLVATVGRVEVSPNAANCIARNATASLDVRHGDDRVRLAAVSQLVELAEKLARDSQLCVRVEYDHEHGAIRMNAPLCEKLEQAIADAGHASLRLSSGAGHDAGVMAAVAPTAMLFIRCRGGVSHSPDESVTQADVAAAIDAMIRLVEQLALR